jgi:hypothetical protein
MIDNTVYEVKKRISATNLMQLIDINGTKKNFQSDFVITLEEPIKKINVCVINQNQLDNGDFDFEETENGRYNRRVVYKKNQQLNHYIAIKKHHSDKSPDNINCDVIIHLQELEPDVIPPPVSSKSPISIKPPVPSPELNAIPNLNFEMPEDHKNILREKLQKLSDDDEYLSYKLKEKYKKENFENIQSTPSQNQNIENKKLYLIIGSICILLFGYLFYVKKIKK